ncbi:hypothetical protein BD626DRAFT_488987 [Schizophyllum amplum]|uniref:SUZ domain-containing protein n=1 Tax=Schizophyllum amplum TaxID=97359 RepID=A0A550CL65_9AGAR|nr:hypothetical protein BD626DRAFT_488987 [Auriculariopsis ampla]
MSVEALCSQAQRTADGMAPTATLLSSASRTEPPVAPSQIIILSPHQHAPRQNDPVRAPSTGHSSSSSSSPPLNADGPVNPTPESAPPISPSNSASLGHDVDPQIMEALKSKDRLYVLKQAELIESLIFERTPRRLELSATSSYQRLLVHRCSAYYRVQPEHEAGAKTIHVSLTPDSRIPTKRIAELVPAEQNVQPTFKIMRRNNLDRRQTRSQAGSTVGDDADFSDSEIGSVGGRSNATGYSKRHMTIEEREAAYNEARSRIFMDFEEKERSASSSSISGGMGSTLSEYDESAGSPPTESEWSAPSAGRKEGRRSTNNPSRSMRGQSASYNAAGSSRNSRAPSPSPSFQYASLYEQPAAATTGYEPQGGMPPYNGTQYYIPFPTHSFPPYPFYPPFGSYQQQPPATVEEGSPTTEQPTQPNHAFAGPYVPVFYPGMGYPQFPPPPMTAPAMMQPPQLYEPPSINGSGANGRGNGHSNNQSRSSNGDAYGPRLSGMRRQSSHSSHSSLGQSRSSDEVSSVASSSTTSSSSRRTYTSTASSQPPHPLPARPDWAVGLKPEPTLHATGNQRVQPRPVPVLQAQDFPPLTTQAAPPPERRAPVGGAWASPSSTRSVIMPGKNRGEDCERNAPKGTDTYDAKAGRELKDSDEASALANKMAAATLEDGAGRNGGPPS